MRKLSIIMCVFLVTIALIMTVCVASAENMKITGVVTDKVEKLDKNGKPYTRLIIEFEHTVDGSTFLDTKVFIAFENKQAEFAGVEIGQTITVIGDYRKMADGRESYTLKSLL